MTKDKETKYECEQLSDVLTNIDNKKYTVPIFQREFVWSRDQIINFLNSILNDEPFGNIMIWHDSSKKQLIPSRNEIISNFSSNKNENYDNNHYIIDGQQRLTSMFSIFKNQEISFSKAENKTITKIMKGNLNNFFWNVNEKKFQKNNSKESILIPLKHVIFNWKESIGTTMEEIFKDQTYNYLNEDDKKELRNTIEKINNNLRKIKVGIIKLENYDLDEVIDIFNKINTQGKKLSIFEIINSKWHQINMDLETEFDELIKDVDSKYDFKDIDYQIPLDALFIILNDGDKILSSKEKIEFDVLKSKEKIDEIFKNFKKSFIHACKQLNYWGFKSKTIPSKIIIKWLTYLYFKNNNKDFDGDKNELILKYIAYISLNDHYSNSTNTKLKDDVHFCNSLLQNNETSNIFKKFKIKKIDHKDIIDINYGSNSMLAKLINHTLYENCFDIWSGKNIDKLKSEDIDLHHIFPKKAKNDNGEKYQDIYNKIESYANLMPITKITNREKISNFKPSFYYSKLKENNSSIDKHLESSFVDVSILKNDDFEKFIQDRSKKIANKINQRFKLN